MEKEHLKIVIVGHVDHGKSTLIGRLFFDTDSLPKEKIQEVRQACKELGKEMEFAYLMDHLQEEREQGITIDTAQTFFKTDKRQYVIIDAPGHKEFIKNMVTGASQAEVAILIVDANEGVKEQTKRHSYILGLLGLKQVMVVVNKMDLVGFSEEKFNSIKVELNEFLKSLGIKPNHVIPISAKNGDNIAIKSKNMDWYSGLTVLTALDSFSIPKKQTEKDFRYPIQGVFKVDDKRILMGRIESGRVQKGMSISFLPSGKDSKVKSVEVFLQARDSAQAGESIGITIEDPLFIERGEVCCAGSMPPVKSSVKASLFWMSPRAFNGEKLVFRCATQEVPCNIKIRKRINSSTLELIEENALELKEHEAGEVLIETEKPVVVEEFNRLPELGRFVLVRGYEIVAGGIILAD